MTRTEYLNQLEAYLMKLPQSDRIEAMDYFKELFDDAGPEGEEELMTSLGSPKEAAHDILTTLLDKKINEENSNKNNRQVLQIAIPYPYWLSRFAVASTQKHRTYDRNTPYWQVR